MRRVFSPRLARLYQKQGQSKQFELLFEQGVEAKNIFCTPSLHYFHTLYDSSTHISRSPQTATDQKSLLFPKSQFYRGFATTSFKIEEFR
jgi:hypothetical protein